MNESIDSLRDARVLSILDCNAGCWQIPVAEETQHFAAFTCHLTAWQCVRDPFVLFNAPTTFRRAIDTILAGFKCQLSFFHLDDVIVFSKYPDEQLQHQNEVLKRLEKAGFTIKAST